MEDTFKGETFHSTFCVQLVSKCLYLNIEATGPYKWNN